MPPQFGNHNQRAMQVTAPNRMMQPSGINMTKEDDFPKL
jgi:hypothetical protein